MCEINSPCGGVLREDAEITKELQACGIYDKVIFACLNAHHLVVPARNVIRPPEREVVRGKKYLTPVQFVSMRCENCSKEFTYKAKAGYERKFCTTRCSALYQGQVLRLQRSLQAV